MLAEVEKVYKRLYRSQTERMVAGICGGLAEYFSIDPTLVRLAAVLLAFTGWGLLAYLILWVIIPRQPRVERPSRGGALATRDTTEE